MESEKNPIELGMTKLSVAPMTVSNPVTESPTKLSDFSTHWLPSSATVISTNSASE